MSGLTNHRFFSYNNIKNKTLRFNTPVRIILRNSYNMLLFLSQVPIIGLFLENCYNITIFIDAGSNSTIEFIRCGHIKTSINNSVNMINITEYLSSNITINDCRIDDEWVNSQWQLD